ncbi:unnamed protein product [Echinostoma caproni]|uniref:Uncharacterized protein n=1 Tax=Echinostoma caproni TaxID=27848 RepID=A0A183B0I0_9TREM|nr:unnamed protein product [Echinostoma caproni]
MSPHARQTGTNQVHTTRPGRRNMFVAVCVKQCFGPFVSRYCLVVGGDGGSGGSVVAIVSPRPDEDEPRECQADLIQLTKDHRGDDSDIAHY